MKIAPSYYVKNPHKVNAYEHSDLMEKQLEVNYAFKIWYDTWKTQGGQDVGSCCGGKGISIPFIAKGKRIAEWVNIVKCNFVQGNIAAQESVADALTYLQDNGFPDAIYNDGWMD